MKDLIKPYHIQEKLIRLGSLGDGGYIISLDILSKTDICYSYGIGDNVDFDLAYIKSTGKNVHQYDHTIDFNRIPHKNSNFIQHNEGISGTKTDKTDNYLNHLIINGDTNKQVLLKMDVEGAEYEWLLNTDIEQIAKNTPCIILEFHWVGSYKNIFIDVINKLNKYYKVVHIHQNTYGGMVEGIPDVPEITFVRNDNELLGEPIAVTYPIIGLDYPNAANHKEIPIVYDLTTKN